MMETVRLSKNDPRLQERGLYVYENRQIAWLTGSDGFEFDVSVVGNNLEFFPKRSARQRAFLRELGISH